MLCEHARERLGALRDQELAADERRVVEAHLASCKACAELFADFGQIGRGLAEKGRTAIPAGLAEKVRRTLDAATRPEAGGPAALPAAQHRPAPGTSRASGLIRQAAALIGVAVISAMATWWAMSTASQADRLEREILNAHIRSLLLDSPVQVASSDQHTVKPWFAGKTDIAPAVRDFSAAGFPLLGGRLDYIDGRRTGVLVYKRRLHLINVFVWPAEASDQKPRILTRNGYTLIGWTRSGVATWLISDLNAGELGILADLL